MTMLAVRSRPARGVTRPADRHQGDRRRHAEDPGPARREGARDGAVAPPQRGRRARGRGQAPHLHPPGGPEAGVAEQVPEPARPRAQPAQQRDRRQGEAHAAAQRRAPTTPATTPRDAPARAAVARARNARRVGGGLARHHDPARPHGRSHDPRRQHHEAEHSERARRGRAAARPPPADRGPSGPASRRRRGRGPGATPKVKAPPDGWPSWESTRHSTRMLPRTGGMHGRDDGAGEAGVAPRGAGHDAPVGVEHPKREERLLHGRREHQAHGGRAPSAGGPRPRARRRPASNGPTRPPARRRSRPVPRRATASAHGRRRYQPAPRPSAGNP